METHRELLQQAANLIEEALGRLDVRTTKCKTCGLVHYVNRTHWKQSQELDGILRKLHRLSHFGENGKN